MFIVTTIDVSQHKNKDCRELRQKFQDLVDEEVITIDLLSTKYKINDHCKAHHAPHPILLGIFLLILLS